MLLAYSVQAQKSLEVQLNIDMMGIDTSNVEGIFGLHAQFTQYPYSVSFTDTLLEEITILPTQWLHIPAATRYMAGYYLKFTPSNRQLSPKKYFFQYHDSRKDTIITQLNSYFFNQTPTALFAQMQKNDTLTFFSKYSGNTHEMMPIPNYSLQIVKQGMEYKAYYSQSNTYAHQLTSTSTTVSDSFVLTKTHLTIIQNFEANLWKKVHFDEAPTDHFLPNYSFVALPRQRRVFRASGHIGWDLWQQLLAVNKEGTRRGE
jgi:hypothetical protein